MNLNDITLDVILDYTKSAEWEDVQDMSWTTAEMQELMIKAMQQVKNIAYEPVLAVVISDDEIENRVEEAGKVHWGEYGSGYESGVRTGIDWAIDKMNPNNH